MTPSTACCVCGGGKPPTKNSHVRSWRLEIYGHDLPGGAGTSFLDTEPPLTASPTTAAVVDSSSNTTIDTSDIDISTNDSNETEIDSSSTFGNWVVLNAVTSILMAVYLVVVQI